MNNLISIQLDKINVSPLPSQERRRKRFDEKQLAELAESITRHGLVNPITVRPVGDCFEIVAGERRFVAAGLAGLETIPATVRDLDDTAAAEIQLIENGQRQDQHPLDEAFDFLDMKSVLGYDENEIALRVGKTPAFVANRLKLATLEPSVRERLENGELPLGHALEIAKYPVESHEEITKHAFQWGELLRPLKDFVDRIKQDVLLQLKQAPFSIKSTSLRADGLACIECPERTLAAPLLFGEVSDDKDSCLNRRCWETKTFANIELKREKIRSQLKLSQEANTVASTKPIEPVPLLSDWYSSRESPEGEKILGREYFKPVTKNECEFAIQGVYAHGDKIGKTELICMDRNCATHHGTRSTGGDPLGEAEAKKIRKEEIFDCKVGENVRLQVLKQAASNFDASTTIHNRPDADYWQVRLLARLWKKETNDYSNNVPEVIRGILGVERDTLPSVGFDDNAVEIITALDPALRSKLAFLLCVAHEGNIGESTYWKPQTRIKELAKVFDIDYAKLDAQERINQAPMKQKEVFRKYQQELEAGDRPRIPRPYSDKWKPKE